MPKPKIHWRKNLDKIIEEELTNCGFSPFDGISYSFPVNDEILGVVHITNRLLILGRHRSSVKVRFGLIHYQLSSAMAHFYPVAYHAPWYWTAGTEFSHIKLKQNLLNQEILEIFPDTDLPTQYSLIREMAQQLKNEAIPIITERFQALASLKSYCEETDQRSIDYCAILSLSGEIKESFELAVQLYRNPRLYKENIGFWAEAGPSFFKWVSSGMPNRNLEDARKYVLDGAKERLEEVLQYGRKYEY